ncbi:MAG TPA: polysaccharide biosynthesis/export family protein [Candidatus Acidoferrum sp.]|nr:polysaccharide biosynthesis/export family protein [Candidatus Acidoferrum sp.]
MAKFIRWLLVSGCCLVLSAHVCAADVSAYTLGVGDVIKIFVFNEPDLNQDRVLITDTGTIQFTFLGEVSVIGKTVTQVQQAIVAGLSPDYLVDPKVTVSIVEYRPFYLTGEVNKPGSYPYQPGLTLRQAVTIAGGLTERASKSKMTVVSIGKTEPVKVDMDYEIKPSDTITIDQSFF